MANSKTKVLILGGGFGGIKAALELGDNEALSITLISDRSDFRYYPALYHAATGGRLTAASIPLEEIFKQKNIKVEKQTAKKIDHESRKVKMASGQEYPYDELVIALGVVTNYFGIKGLKEYSYGIKTQQEARELRDHIHKMLLDEGKPDQNYVIIGGGPTGVELAGALPSYIKHIMRRHGLKNKKLHIELVEAAPRLMPRMPRDYSKAVAGHLRKLGIALHLGEAVQAETVDSLKVGDHSIASHTVVWTAGVTNHPFFDTNKFEFGEHGKVKVNEYLEIDPHIYVIGDNADTKYSGMAQTALYDAQYVAHDLARKVAGHHRKAYKPKRPIYVTPAGPRWAAVVWGKVHLYGWLGWTLRSAADFAGYKDYEPWWPASQHWIAEYEQESDCPVCAGNS